MNLTSISPVNTLKAINKSFPENLNERLLIDEPKVLLKLADLVADDLPLQKRLFSFIDLSKTDSKHSIAAANAITILNIAKVNLSLRDFKGVRISHANLSHGIMTRSDFSYADLRNVQMIDAVLDYSSIAFCDVEGLQLGQHPLFLYPSEVNAMAVSFDGQFILAAVDKEIYLTDFHTGKIMFVFKGHDLSITSVAFSPDGKWILSGSEDKTVRLWDRQKRKEIHCFKGHTACVTSVAFSLDNKWALSGGLDHCVNVWDCKIGENKICLKDYDRGITSVIRNDGLLRAENQIVSIKWFHSMPEYTQGTQKLSDSRLRELMGAIYQHRQNAKNYVLEANHRWESIGDKILRDAIASAIGGLVSAAATKTGPTTLVICAAISALAGVTTNLVYEYYEIQDLLEKAQKESELADSIEKFILENL